MSVVEERLAKLDEITLDSGGHSSFEAGVCAMEAVAWVAGEPHSDHPECASKVITAFLVSWNDSLRSNEERDRLIKPLVPLVVGTRTTAADEETRAWMATDWLVREQAPAWLRLAGLTEHAEALENLAALKGRASAVKAQPKLDEARKASAAAGDAAGAAAWDAAWDAAWAAARAAAGAAARAAAGDAAWAAAWAAARAAAWAAARDAAWAAAWAAAGAAAWDAAWDAAWAAARAAAGAAARAAAWAALEPTVTLLQPSAALLVKRMCEVGR